MVVRSVSGWPWIGRSWLSRPEREGSFSYHVLLSFGWRNLLQIIFSGFRQWGCCLAGNKWHVLGWSGAARWASSPWISNSVRPELIMRFEKRYRINTVLVSEWRWWCDVDVEVCRSTYVLRFPIYPTFDLTLKLIYLGSLQMWLLPWPTQFNFEQYFLFNVLNLPFLLN